MLFDLLLPDVCPAGKHLVERDDRSSRVEQEINSRWQEFMAPFFESPNNARPDEMFVELTEIFHLD
ncbi:MAG: L-rhamnose mutarotase [Roseiflexaceae bacterium]